MDAKSRDNVILLGEPGSGKTFSIKNHLTSIERRHRNKLIIHDHHEYKFELYHLLEMGFKYYSATSDLYGLLREGKLKENTLIEINLNKLPLGIDSNTFADFVKRIFDNELAHKANKNVIPDAFQSGWDIYFDGNKAIESISKIDEKLFVLGKAYSFYFYGGAFNIEELKPLGKARLSQFQINELADSFFNNLNIGFNSSVKEIYSPNNKE